MGSGKYPSMQQEYKERNKGLTELTLEAAGGRKRTHFDACRHRANTLWAVPIVLGDPVVYYVNTAKFRHQAGSDFMSNVRLSLPLRWSALPAANLSDQVLRIMRSLALGGGGLEEGGWREQKQFVHRTVITVISSTLRENSTTL